MIASPREFNFNSVADLDAHVQARIANVKYIEKLATTVSFSENGAKLPLSSWGFIKTGGRRKDGSDRGFWKPSKDWMTALVEARDIGGQMDCSKPGELARMFGDHALNKGTYDPMGNYSGAVTTTSEAGRSTDWIPGDQGKLWNKNPNPPSYWVNENFTYLGNGRHYANGTSIGGSYIHSFQAVCDFTQNMGQAPGAAGIAPEVDLKRNSVKTGLADQL